MSPDEGLSTGLFTPLAAVVVLYLVLRLAGHLLAGRRGEGALDLSFAVLLLGSLYVLVLLLYAVASKFALISDMLIIVAILFGFFALLLIGLLGIFDLGFGGISRARAERRRERSGD